MIGDFNTLEKRIGKKNISKKDLNENPIILMAYDLLEVGGKDIRTQPLSERQKKLEFILKQTDYKLEFFYLDIFKGNLIAVIL